MSAKVSVPGSLHLIEIAAGGGSADIRSRVEDLVRHVGGAVVESVWAARLGRLYLIADRLEPAALRSALTAAGLQAAEIAPVRLIGTPADAAAPAPSHLVEWDLPPDLGMERYLKRKAEKSPLYAQVPEVKFLRTYVREDTVKCLCLYDAPDEEAVRRARAAVSAPISRLDQVEADGGVAASVAPSRAAAER
ncbi:MAG: DUF4242 domain-containing protein [Polyangia bacterium]|jgi:Protein of unknown function (DUF4242)